MKVLCSQFNNALYHITLGWKNALERIGVEWYWWNPEHAAAFDAFDEVEPDIFIGSTYELNSAIIKCIAARPDMKVVLKANNWGPVDSEIDTEKFPIGIADDEEKSTVTKLRQETGRPDLLFNFYHPNRMKETMGHWDDNGVPTIAMQPAADTTVYFPVESVPELQCDIGFVGGYWGYKGRNIDKYLLPLCYPVGKYNIKIFGNQGWPVPQHMGLASDETCNALFSSALICPNVSEPHANIWGWEVNERPFKVAACKCLCISDPIASLSEDVFPNSEVICVTDHHDFHKTMASFIDNQKKDNNFWETQIKKDYIDPAYETVMAGHTYFHRTKDLLEALGLEKEAKDMQEYLNNA